MTYGKSNSFSDLTDRLVDHGYRALARTAFVGLGAADLAADVLQTRKRRMHRWLLRKRLAYARGDQ